MSNDSFEGMTPDDIIEALKPENWTETTTLHTPTLQATLQDKLLMLAFPDGQARVLIRSDVEALTRFLHQYAGADPLPAAEVPFPSGWQPTSVESYEEIETRIQEAYQCDSNERVRRTI